MILPDVNILIYAHRKEDPAHAFYKAWLEREINAIQPVAISSLAAATFVRIVTHPSFKPFPTPQPQALAIMDQIRAHPNCRWIAPGPRHWDIFRELCAKTGAAGKLVADAQHAAVAIEHGCHWATRDLDFQRFEPHGLKLHVISPQ